MKNQYKLGLIKTWQRNRGEKDHEDILNGESKNVEFKSELPEKSDKYMKSIIAFANTSGGILVIGINDETKATIGVDKESVFQIMDGIENAISDCCEP
ncbi:helix-turn-helix domain-containing protein [Eubacterium callanderi]|uniref:AlbA family DNA-binding domain-containing protein n=1 Tax=Eubacterium callanderi TaxID=53442 RepID=UPI00399A3CF7